MVAENVGSAHATPQPGPPVLSHGLSEAECERTHNAHGLLQLLEDLVSPRQTATYVMYPMAHDI